VRRMLACFAARPCADCRYRRFDRMQIPFRSPRTKKAEKPVSKASGASRGVHDLLSGHARGAQIPCQLMPARGAA
jgi:hypothetical protein